MNTLPPSLLVNLWTGLLTNGQEVLSPYKLLSLVELFWLFFSLGGLTIGRYLKIRKSAITIMELGDLNKNNIIEFDKWATSKYSEFSDKVSDYPFYASFVLPFGLLLHSSTQGHFIHIFILYLEGLATTGCLYAIVSGLIDKYRPLVYNETVPKDQRLKASGRCSFFSGHVAMTATATFFFAKVLTDLVPESPLLPYFWAFSIMLPIIVGYYRIDAGKHFPSDVIVGYTVGATVGIMVPELHKYVLDVMDSIAFQFGG